MIGLWCTGWSSYWELKSYFTKGLGYMVHPCNLNPLVFLHIILLYVLLAWLNIAITWFVVGYTLKGAGYYPRQRMALN